jgi:hypothetical protein
MDEISKEIQQRNLGIQMKDGLPKVGCLLWMDDVALIAKDANDMQEMLTVTNNIAKKYHIKFGEEKSKVLVIGRKKVTTKFTMDKMNIDPTANYKYLGVKFNNKMNLKDHIAGIKCKMEGAYQTLIAIAEDNNLRGIQMRSIWNLIRTCIEPIITYGLEAMRINKTEMKQINSIWTNIIKRILMVPQSTPNEAIYIEAGLLDIETIVDINKLKMAIRLKRTANKLIEMTIDDETPGGWKEEITKILEKYSITKEELASSKKKLNRTIIEKIQRKFLTKDHNRDGKQRVIL